MKISLIAAVAENQVIGGGNRLLWQLPNDMQFFRRMTEGHPVIMGRKTFESIGRPLPKRQNIVITRREGIALPGCIIVHSLEEALNVAREAKSEEVFVIGGGEVYRESLSIADRVYLTRVHASFEGDTFFPLLDSNQWVEAARDERPADERHAYAYTFLTYDRKGVA